MSVLCSNYREERAPGSDARGFFFLFTSPSAIRARRAISHQRLRIFRSVIGRKLPPVAPPANFFAKNRPNIWRFERKCLPLHPQNKFATNMVPVVQLVRASDCGSECRGFESHRAPKVENSGISSKQREFPIFYAPKFSFHFWK